MTMSTTATSTMLEKSDFAKRQLERMGWKEGNGLGKDRQGMATPIMVKKRSDETGGLGIEKEKVRLVQETLQDEWWKDALGDTLSKLSSKSKGDKKKKKRKRDNNEEVAANDDVNQPTATTKKVYTDEELFLATGGARFGMRAGKTRNQAKWRRVEEQERKIEYQQQEQIQKVQQILSEQPLQRHEKTNETLGNVIESNIITSKLSQLDEKPTTDDNDVRSSTKKWKSVKTKEGKLASNEDRPLVVETIESKKNQDKKEKKKKKDKISKSDEYNKLDESLGRDDRSGSKNQQRIKKKEKQKKTKKVNSKRIK